MEVFFKTLEPSVWHVEGPNLVRNGYFSLLTEFLPVNPTLINIWGGATTIPSFGDLSGSTTTSSDNLAFVASDFSNEAWQAIGWSLDIPTLQGQIQTWLQLVMPQLDPRDTPLTCHIVQTATSIVAFAYFGNQGASLSPSGWMSGEHGDLVVAANETVTIGFNEVKNYNSVTLVGPNSVIQYEEGPANAPATEWAMMSVKEGLTMGSSTSIALPFLPKIGNEYNVNGYLPPFSSVNPDDAENPLLFNYTNAQGGTGANTFANNGFSGDQYGNGGPGATVHPANDGANGIDSVGADGGESGAGGSGSSGRPGTPFYLRVGGLMSLDTNTAISTAGEPGYDGGAGPNGGDFGQSGGAGGGAGGSGGDVRVRYGSVVGDGNLTFGTDGGSGGNGGAGSFNVGSTPGNQGNGGQVDFAPFVP